MFLIFYFEFGVTILAKAKVSDPFYFFIPINVSPADTALTDRSPKLFALALKIRAKRQALIAQADTAHSLIIFFTPFDIF